MENTISTKWGKEKEKKKQQNNRHISLCLKLKTFLEKEKLGDCSPNNSENLNFVLINCN